MNTIYSSHRHLCVVVFLGNKTNDRGIVSKEHQHHGEEEAFVAGKPVESWLSTVKAYQSTSGFSENQIVYSYDEEGNEVPIGIIIDGTFAQKDNTM